MRLLLLLPLLGLMFGCTTAPTPTPRPLIQELAKTTIPFELPAPTIGMMRVNLRDAGVLWERVLPVLRDKTPEVEKELTKVGLQEPAHIITWLLITNATSSPMKAFDPSWLQGLDPNATLHVALGLPGNEDIFEGVRTASPVLGLSNLPQGPLFRFYLPATQPQVLAKGLESARAALSQASSKTWKVTALPRGVQLDLRAFDIQNLMTRYKRDIERTAVSRDTTFLSRDTPGLRAYLSNDSSMGVFLRSDRLAMFTAHVGHTEMFEALEAATPESRDKLWGMGLDIIMRGWRLDDPERHENYDSVMLLKVAKPAGLVFEFSQSLTPLGQAIRAKAQTRLPFSKPSTSDTILDLSLNAQRQDERSTPQDLLTLSKDEIRNTLRDSGGFAMLTLVMNHPSSALRILSAHGQSKLLAGFRGVRLSLGFRASPHAALVLGFESGTFDLAKTMLLPMLQNVQRFPGGNVDAALLTTHGEIRVTVGKASIQEAPPMSSNFSLSMSLGDLASAGASMFAADSAFLSALFAAILGKDAVIEGALREYSDHQIVRLATKNAEKVRLQYPPGAATKPNIVARSPCMRQAREQSLQQITALSMSTPERRLAAFEEAITKLERARTSCKGHEVALDNALARWLILRASHASDLLKLDQARADYERACKLGASQACTFAQEAQAEQTSLRVPEVTIAPKPKDPTICSYLLSQGGTLSERPRPTSIALNPPTHTKDLDETLAFMKNFGPQENPALVINADTPASHVAQILSTLNTPERSKKRQRISRLLRHENTPVHLYAQVMHKGVIQALPIYAAHEDSPDIIRVRVSAMGLSYEGPGGIKKSASCPPRKRCGLPDINTLVQDGQSLAGAFTGLKGQVKVTLRVRPSMTFGDAIQIIAAIQSGFAQQGLQAQVALP